MTITNEEEFEHLKKQIEAKSFEIFSNERIEHLHVIEVETVMNLLKMLMND